MLSFRPTRYQRVTHIEFDEKGSLILVRTFNTQLKKKLYELASSFPESCQVLDDDPDLGCTEFSVAKGRLSFRITKPYSEDRIRKIRETARASGFHSSARKNSPSQGNEDP